MKGLARREDEIIDDIIETASDQLLNVAKITYAHEGAKTGYSRLGDINNIEAYFDEHGELLIGNISKPDPSFFLSLRTGLKDQFYRNKYEPLFPTAFEYWVDDGHLLDLHEWFLAGSPSGDKSEFFMNPRPYVENAIRYIKKDANEIFGDMNDILRRVRR